MFIAPLLLAALAAVDGPRPEAKGCLDLKLHQLTGFTESGWYFKSANNVRFQGFDGTKASDVTGSRPHNKDLSIEIQDTNLANRLMRLRAKTAAQIPNSKNPNAVSTHVLEHMSKWALNLYANARENEKSKFKARYDLAQWMLFLENEGIPKRIKDDREYGVSSSRNADLFSQLLEEYLDAELPPPPRNSDCSDHTCLSREKNPVLGFQRSGFYLGSGPNLRFRYYTGQEVSDIRGRSPHREGQFGKPSDLFASRTRNGNRLRNTLSEFAKIAPNPRNPDYAMDTLFQGIYLFIRANQNYSGPSKQRRKAVITYLQVTQFEGIPSALRQIQAEGDNIGKAMDVALQTLEDYVRATEW